MGVVTYDAGVLAQCKFQEKKKNTWIPAHHVSIHLSGTQIYSAALLHSFNPNGLAPDPSLPHLISSN